MKKLTIIVLILVLSICLVPSSSLAEGDPVGVSSSIFYLDTENGGEVLINLAIENKLNESIEVEVSDWHDYTYPDSTQQWINPKWLVSVEPNTFDLPVGGQGIANILFDIPEDADEVKYITWIKVTVGGWQKPVTVIIRKGEASEAIDFSVSPSYFKILVQRGTGTTQYINWSPIVVKNKCKNEILTYASAEDRTEPLEITAGSSIQHTNAEIGTVYENIRNSEAQEWFGTSYTRENPLPIEGYVKGNLSWSLDVPEDVKDGKYVFGVRVEAIQFEGSTSNININYVIWMLVDVNRVENGNNNSDNSFMWWLVYIGGGIIGLLILNEIRLRVKLLEFVKARVRRS